MRKPKRHDRKVQKRAKENALEQAGRSQIACDLQGQAEETHLIFWATEYNLRFLNNAVT